MSALYRWPTSPSLSRSPATKSSAPFTSSGSTVMTLIVPSSASVPYTAEPGPGTTSIRCTF